MIQYSTSRITRGAYLAGMVAVLLLALALRLYLLEADAPLDLSPSQELTLDGPVTIAAGRDRALFGSWDPYPGPLQPYRLYPAMSWLAYFFFSTLGTGYWQANAISVVTGFLSIVFMAAFAREQFGRRVSLIVSLMLATNYVYVIYNRDPMAYTTAACGMAASLYLWGKGLRLPLWSFLAGAITVFTALFVKLPALAMIPAAAVGYAVWFCPKRGKRGFAVYAPPMLYALGSLLTAALWYAAIYLPHTQVVEQAYYVRTFSPTYTLMDNVRFAIQSLLLFGVDFGFNMRMLPLFLLAYGYLFFRIAQLLSWDRPRLSAADAASLAYLLGTVLMLFASGIRPLRFQILLIPPMSLVGALALEAWLRRDRLPLPEKFGRLFPILVQGLLAYYAYQFLAAVLIGYRVLRFKAGPVDASVAPTISDLYTLVGAGLLMAILGTMAFLGRVVQAQKAHLLLPRRLVRWRLALIVILLGVGSDLVQYWTWARSPQYSIIEASRQLGDSLDQETAVLGGTYAYTLALDNDLPAIWFYGHSPGQAILESDFTHIAMEAASPISNELTNDGKLRQNLPELMARSRLVSSYDLRGYIVNLYKLAR